MRMHDSIHITYQFSARSGYITDMNIDTTTDDDGAFSTVRISFEQDLATTTGNCADNIVL
jgi:hypothetical protein